MPPFLGLDSLTAKEGQKRETVRPSGSQKIEDKKYGDLCL